MIGDTTCYAGVLQQLLIRGYGLPRLQSLI